MEMCAVGTGAVIHIAAVPHSLGGAMDFEGRYEPPGSEVEADEAFDVEESQRSQRKRRKRPAPGKVTRTLSMDGLEAFARELRSERSRETSDVPAPPERARVGAVQADGGRVAAMDP